MINHKAESGLSCLLDKGTYRRHFQDIISTDFLGFNANKAYSDQIIEATNKTGDNDAICVYDGDIKSHRVILGIMNFKFIGGSMGSVVGEIVSRALVLAGEIKAPFILEVISPLKGINSLKRWVIIA